MPRWAFFVFVDLSFLWFVLPHYGASTFVIWIALVWNLIGYAQGMWFR